VRARETRARGGTLSEFSHQELQHQRLLKDIQRIVADAMEAGEALYAAEHAARLFAACPECGFSIGRIVDELTLAASGVRVPVEIARPE